MASGRVFLGLVSLMTAGAAHAAPAHLALSLHGLEPTAEISYHPYRWLTIRRSVAYVRSTPVDDIRAAGRSPLPQSRMQALTGAVHPFGDAFRLSFGVREDDNHRLLRGTDQSTAIGTGQYTPLVTVGFGGTVDEHLSVSGDMGFVGRNRVGPRGTTLVTPFEQMKGVRSEGGYRPVIQLSAGYRF